MRSKLFILAIYSISLSSCFYDSEDKLYPNTPACDTLNVSYANGVNPILQSRCFNCHGNSRLGSIYDFEGYADLVAMIGSQNFLGAIKQVPGILPMPQGADKLTDCQINTIQAWINQGKLNN